jgi:hypothetical protein
MGERVFEDEIHKARVRLFEAGGMELRRISQNKGEMFPVSPEFATRAAVYNRLADLHAKNATVVPPDCVKVLESILEGWND